MMIFQTRLMIDAAIETALLLACEEAERCRGATAPNPPVGAAALNQAGEILSVQAHQKAGTAHAEARVIEDCLKRCLLDQIDTMIVTLEPCNHTGRTPPCSEALLKLPTLKRVCYAVADPHPKAMGGGKRLTQAGLLVQNLSALTPGSSGVKRAQELTRPFFHWLLHRRPWVTVKTAWLQTADGFTMVPPPGRKTFTQASSLRLAHELRKRSDAIVTGSGTVLADWPELTVRHVPDHPAKTRWLSVLDRRARVPKDWLEKRRSQGFQVVSWQQDFQTLLEFLGEQGVLEVLVEAGPTLSGSILEARLWNEHFRILSCPSNTGAAPGGLNDRIEHEVRHSQVCSSED